MKFFCHLLFKSKVPEHFSFIEVVDMYIKIHKIFGFTYHKAISQCMLFLECKIFNMKENESLMTPNTKTVAMVVFNDSNG